MSRFARGTYGEVARTGVSQEGELAFQVSLERKVVKVSNKNRTFVFE